MKGRPARLAASILSAARWAAGVFAIISTAGCVVFAPETTASYNPECQTVERHMHLKAYQIAVIVGCENEGCIQALALAGVVSASTMVISGSVALLGDMVYWLEARGNCLRSKLDAHQNAGELPISNE